MKTKLNAAQDTINIAENKRGRGRGSKIKR